jgi:hypothetical protein
MENMGTYGQTSVDGKSISFLYRSGEYEVADSAIGDVRIIPCMRDLAAGFNAMTVLVVRLESEQLPWESDITQMFFLQPSDGNRYRIIFSLKTALSSHRDSTSSIIKRLLLNTPYSFAAIWPEPNLEFPYPNENDCHAWDVELSYAPGDETFADFYHIRRLLSQTVFLPGEMISATNIGHLPDGMDHAAYARQLDVLAAKLNSIPLGHDGAHDFEEATGDIIRLCFFQALKNAEARSRDIDRVVIRDWITSNRATSGFWSSMRQRYNATSVIWECKNYEDLKAADFQQVAFYMSETLGRLAIITFRGEIRPSYFGQIRRIAERGGMVIPLGSSDLKTLVNQNRHGNIGEDLIQDRYDQIVRKIS